MIVMMMIETNDNGVKKMVMMVLITVMITSCLLIGHV